MSTAQISPNKSWQLAQAQTAIDLFAEAHGRGPNTRDELGQFLELECAAGRLPGGPIQPSTEALLKIAKNGCLV
jgi:hypothetical protein